MGDGTFAQKLKPTEVLDLAGIVSLTAGGPHTCALTSGGVTWCWGSGGFGELGNWSFSNTPRATVAQGAATGATAITAGQSHTCVELGNQIISCFGWDGSGQLGQGTATRRLTPVPAQASMPATLAVNTGSGKPGSEFVLTGQRFVAGETINFTINGSPAALTLPTGAEDSGSFVIDLITSPSNGAGIYLVKAASASAQATTGVRLSNDLPVRTDPGSSLSISAAGEQPVQPRFVHLPVQLR